MAAEIGESANGAFGLESSHVWTCFPVNVASSLNQVDEYFEGGGGTARHEIETAESEGENVDELASHVFPPLGFVI